ncbi:hypothetical protein BKA81DRAFT_382463 [Phyllosticta paracitricarpa]
MPEQGIYACFRTQISFQRVSRSLPPAAEAFPNSPLFVTAHDTAASTPAARIPYDAIPAPSIRLPKGHFGLSGSCCAYRSLRMFPCVPSALVLALPNTRVPAHPRRLHRGPRLRWIRQQATSVHIWDTLVFTNYARENQFRDADMVVIALS